MTRSDWVFEPRDFIRFLRSLAGSDAYQVRLPRLHAIVFGRDYFDRLCRACDARKVRWDPSYAIGRVGQQDVAVQQVPVGAPGAVLGLEEAVALGARTFLTFGGCGSLVPNLSLGSLIVPTGAYSEEGTSRHYGGGRWSWSDQGLVKALVRASERCGVKARQGLVWTTDAPYRESRAKVRALAARGVMAVEMEASALYTVARHRKVRIASLFVVSDEIGGDSWNAGFRSAPYAQGKREGLRVLIDALSRRLP